MHIENFRIAVPDAKLAELQQKLALTTWPDELDGSGWDYGAPLADVKRLAKYWQSNFDWRQEETKLNQLPQFTAKVPVEGYGDVDVHFVHQKSGNPNAIPLLFVHGWPGSFIEVMKLLPLLKGGDGSPAFDIIAPSLPNYGFSGGIKQKGFGLAKYAECTNALMTGLGYHKYVGQGGDWGFYIVRTLARMYPQNILATHINMVRCDPPSFTSSPLLAIQNAVTPYSQRERESFARNKCFLEQGAGYRLEQATKPQTLGYGLADSPVGLLAWIYEKLHDWTDSYPWTEDEVLTWISIYYFSTAGPAASVRIYYEATHEEPSLRLAASAWVPGVRLATAHFPKELSVYPKLWAHTLGPIVYSSDNESGGHFAAWERPKVIAGDLQNMFKKGGPCHGLVPGSTGY